MKKFILSILMLFCLLPNQVLAQEIPVFNANGQKLPLTPSAYTENDITMLPLRAIAEYLEAEVSWQSNGTINISKDDCLIALTVGHTNVTITANNEQKTLSLSEPPLYKDNTLFVPMRFIAETFNMPVNYCVNYQDDTKYPAIFLGKSKYANNYNFEHPDKDNIDTQVAIKMQNEMLSNNSYSLEEQSYINSVFISNIMGLYAEYYNLYQPFDEYEKQIYDYLSFYISDNVLSSNDWQQFLALAKHQKSEITVTPLKITITEEKIYGTYCFQLFDTIFILPLLAEIELTRCDDSLKEIAPSQPFQIYPTEPENAISETDSKGHLWRVTKVTNPRAYINLQALRDNEPEMYERFIAQ